MYAFIFLATLYSSSAFLLGASITAGLFMFHVAVVPLIFKYSKTFQRSLVFANFVSWPLHVDFEEPSKSGIEGGRNLSIEFQSKIDRCKVKIGIWHILPKSTYERLKHDLQPDIDKEKLNIILDNELFTTRSPIILYCHGNSSSRGAAHRIQLYKFFQQMDFHTIAFDYRGYGDSTNINPSEPGVVEDSLVVYEWLCNNIAKYNRDPEVYVWGHSLGTGISSNMLGNIQSLSENLLERDKPLPLPKGLILEAPFSNLADEVAKHPLSKLVTWLPYYERTIVSPFRDCREYSFNSDIHLKKVHTLPILILHAKDDVIVPFDVGVKLFNAIKESRGDNGGFIKLHAYEPSLGLGHKHICNANDLSKVVSEFIASNQ